MIALDLPTTQGCYLAPSADVHKELFAASATENGMVISLDALSRTFIEIDRLRQIEPRTEAASALAVERAKRLLSEAQTIVPIFLVTSTIESSDGDVLLHWDAPSKSVVLVSPAEERNEPQIYRETLEGKKAVHSEIGEATAEFLSESLAWVLQPK
jgi:hypothetical protein